MTSGEIDPRLRGVFHAVTMRMGRNLLNALELKGLAQQSNGDWELQGNLTYEGFEVIAQALINGLRIIFSNAKLTFPPNFYPEEIELSNSIVEGIGLPEIRTEGNRINIEFGGKKPLIRQIISILDPTQIRDGETPQCNINLAQGLTVRGNGFVFVEEQSIRPIM